LAADGWTSGSTKRLAQAVAVVVVLVLAGVLVWRLAFDRRGVDTGQPAPPLSLGRLDTQGRLALSSLRGKVVAVNFWASWCGPCRDEAPLLERLWNENRGRGLVVLGVDAMDAAGDARKFMRKYGLTYPVVHDAHGSTLGHWGVPGLPTTFVVGRDGRVVAKVIGGLRTGDNEEAFEQKVSKALTT
jgi:cytochrome c biogenesis protein CcmG/thiol:disulfide interchange protein DsbE